MKKDIIKKLEKAFKHHYPARLINNISGDEVEGELTMHPSCDLPEHDEFDEARFNWEDGDFSKVSFEICPGPWAMEDKRFFLAEEIVSIEPCEDYRVGYVIYVESPLTLYLKGMALWVNRDGDDFKMGISMEDMGSIVNIKIPADLDVSKFELKQVK